MGSSRKVKPAKPKAKLAKSLQKAKAAARSKPAAKAKTKAQKSTAYTRDLDKNPANYQALSPLSFLERAAFTFPKRIAILHGDQQFTYAQFYERCRRLASALVRHCVSDSTYAGSAAVAA